jgi:hypothetical protein
MDAYAVRLVAQARNIGKNPHLWGDPLTPDGVKYPFDAGNWSLDQPRVRKGFLKNGFSTVSLATPLQNTVIFMLHLL